MLNPSPIPGGQLCMAGYGLGTVASVNPLADALQLSTRLLLEEGMGWSWDLGNSKGLISTRILWHIINGVYICFFNIYLHMYMHACKCLYIYIFMPVYTYIYIHIHIAEDWLRVHCAKQPSHFACEMLSCARRCGPRRNPTSQEKLLRRVVGKEQKEYNGSRRWAELRSDRLR